MVKIKKHKAFKNIAVQEFLIVTNADFEGIADFERTSTAESEKLPKVTKKRNELQHDILNQERNELQHDILNQKDFNDRYTLVVNDDKVSIKLLYLSCLL